MVVTSRVSGDHSMKLELGIDPEDWHSQSVRWGHPIHSICSYMAAFPPRVPHYFIDRFTEKGDIVLDPFSGRGTVPAEACLMDRIGIGNDLNPIAHVLTKAKVKTPRRKSVLKRLDSLVDGFESESTAGVTKDVKMLFSRRTLQQLLFLRKMLNPNKSTVDNLIMAVILGGLHGNSRKPSYMSIPMPNTFSMSPGYVQKYIKGHNLKPPSHDAFQVIRHRLRRCYRERTASTKGFAHCSDFRRLPGLLRNRKADMIFTSPPYLRVIRYGKLNWIRLWMLDIEPKTLDKKLDDKHTLPKYIDFMKETINALARMMKDDALCFIVLGQVAGNRGPGENKSLALGEKIQGCLDKKVDLSFIGFVNDRYNKDVKVSRIWGGKLKGRATSFDQILVLCKDYDEVRRKEFKDSADWDRSHVPYSQATLND